MSSFYTLLMEEMDALRDIISSNQSILEAADPQLIVVAIDGRMVVALCSHLEDQELPDNHTQEEFAEAAVVCLRKLAARVRSKPKEMPS